MGLGGDVCNWMEETGFQGSFMDAWEAYGNGDDCSHVPKDSHSESESETELETEPDEIIILKDSVPFVAGEVYTVAGACAFPFKVRMLRTTCELGAGNEAWVTGRSENGRWFLLEDGRKLPSEPHLADLIWTKIQEPPTHWELLEGLFEGAPSRVAKSQHGDVWLEHDGLPFQFCILRTTNALCAGDVLWVKGTSKDGTWLLLENGCQVPSEPHFAKRLYTEIKAMDMQQEDKLSLLMAIAECGSTKIWRDQLRDDVASRPAAPRMARGRHAAGVRGMFCCQCGVTKAADAFSSTQRKRANALRRCKACIQASEGGPMGLSQTAS